MKYLVECYKHEMFFVEGNEFEDFNECMDYAQEKYDEGYEVYVYGYFKFEGIE